MGFHLNFSYTFFVIVIWRKIRCLFQEATHLAMLQQKSKVITLEVVPNSPQMGLYRLYRAGLDDTHSFIGDMVCRRNRTQYKSQDCFRFIATIYYKPFVKSCFPILRSSLLPKESVLTFLVVVVVNTYLHKLRNVEKQ